MHEESLFIKGEIENERVLLDRSVGSEVGTDLAERVNDVTLEKGTRKNKPVIENISTIQLDNQVKCEPSTSLLAW